MTFWGVQDAEYFDNKRQKGRHGQSHGQTELDEVDAMDQALKCLAVPGSDVSPLEPSSGPAALEQPSRPKQQQNQSSTLQTNDSATSTLNSTLQQIRLPTTPTKFEPRPHQTAGVQAARRTDRYGGGKMADTQRAASTGMKA